jgi:hypothetical protein
VGGASPDPMYARGREKQQDADHQQSQLLDDSGVRGSDPLNDQTHEHQSNDHQETQRSSVVMKPEATPGSGPGRGIALTSDTGLGQRA